MRTIALAVSLAGAPALAQSTATYRVTFDAEWSGTTHPTAYPFGAHFSPLVGATHSDRARFWQPGGTATAGIELMAETGTTPILEAEINSAINAGDAHMLIVESSGISSPGSTSLEFDATSGMPLVTLVTMVAPSPDWFIGVDSVPLLTGAGWADTIVVDLFAYDSGTDSGTQFRSSNSDVTPHAPISDFSATPPFAGTPRLGTFTFTLLATDPAACSPADITTQGPGPGDPLFGVPDGLLSNADLLVFVNAWITGEPAIADVTTAGASQGEPGFGTPDAQVTNADIQYFVNLFVAGCP